MITIIKPESINDDAKFTVNAEELAKIKYELENLRFLDNINGVYIRIAICAYEDNGIDLLEGKTTFSGDVYFAIDKLLNS